MNIKEELSQCELKVVAWTSPRAGFFQRLSVPELVKSLSHKRRFPKTANRVVKKVVESGLLSEEENGNYEIYSAVFPDFVLNPVLNGEELFFVREEDAKIYASKMGVRGLVRCVGNYNLPERDLSGADWQVFRLKSYVEGDETPLHILLERGTLTDRKKDSFGVYFQAGDSSHGRRYINPFFYERKRDALEIYFSYHDDAKRFANSFPVVGLKRLEVQGN